MEKKIWTRPMAEIETFMANEYIAKCSNNKDEFYTFVCNAGHKNQKYHLYFETNNVEGLQAEGTTWNPDFYRSNSYSPCNAVHYVPAKYADFSTGYIYKGKKGDFANAQEVIVWKGHDGMNGHCTTQLMSSMKLCHGNKS